MAGATSSGIVVPAGKPARRKLRYADEAPGNRLQLESPSSRFSIDPRVRSSCTVPESANREAPPAAISKGFPLESPLGRAQRLASYECKSAGDYPRSSIAIIEGIVLTAPPEDREEGGEARAWKAIVTLDPGGWCSHGGGLADGRPPAASSSSSTSSFQAMSAQEFSLLMPGTVSWWPRHGWEPWLQHNAHETGCEYETKLEVTPESNDTSTSEVA
ncbi:hypothetical protein KM043_006645 [Ampulex compressa]|nr:hypothetical protein KM043_006645 [Ampulex compressa]